MIMLASKGNRASLSLGPPRVSTRPCCCYGPTAGDEADNGGIAVVSRLGARKLPTPSGVATVPATLPIAESGSAIFAKSHYEHKIEGLLSETRDFGGSLRANIHQSFTRPKEAAASLRQ